MASEGVGSPTSKIEEGEKATIDTETDDKVICIIRVSMHAVQVLPSYA